VELALHFANNTWEIVDRQPDMDLLLMKWCFLFKSDENGEDICKARLVARRDLDHNQYLEHKIYSLVCPEGIIALILSIAVRQELRIFSLDIQTAYLYGPIKESRRIFLRIPQVLDIDPNKKACKLNKAIYDLCISSKCWKETFEEEILANGLQQSCTERCVYFDSEEGKLTIVAMYVDDVLVESNDDVKLTRFFGSLQTKFKLRIY